MTEEELAASKARANIKRGLRRLWSGDSSEEEICDELGIGMEELQALKVELSLGPRQGFYVPSPARIRVECARFRASWSPAELDARIERARSGRME